MNIPDASTLRATAPRPANGVASYTPREPSLDGVINGGRAMQEAAQTIAYTNERQDTMTAQAAVNALNKQAVNLQVDTKTGFVMAQEGAAVGEKFMKRYTEQFQAAQDQIRGGLENPNQQRIFDQHAEVSALHFRSALLSHQAQQTLRFNERTENDTIDAARREIFAHPGDPTAVGAALTQLDWAINQKAERNGWSEETTAAAKEKYLNSVYVDTVDQMVERDPLGTLPALNRRLGVGEPAALTGNAAIDGLDPKHLVDFRHKAQSYANTFENKTEAEMKARYTAAEKATQELQNFVLTGARVDPGYELQIRAFTTGTPFEAIATALVQGSYAGASFGSKTLPDQEAALRQSDATAAAGTNPLAVQFLEHARTIHENQKAAYKENPWAAASRFGRQPDSPEANITSADQIPQLVQARAKAQGIVEQYAGGPVSALQPNETAKAAKLLRALPPDQAAVVLSQIGIEANSPERISALAAGLGKNDPVLELQMLAAGDKTTAGRTLAELIGRGAQAIADKTIKPDDAMVTGWKAEIASLVNGTLSNPEDEAKVKQSAFYVRAAMEDKSANAAGFNGIGQSSAESAVSLVIGRPITRAGTKTLLPRGMTEFDFNAALKAYTPERLAGMSATGKLYFQGRPVEPSYIWNRIESLPIVRYQSGEYVPLQNNRPFTLDEAGTQPLVLKVAP